MVKLVLRLLFCHSIGISNTDNRGFDDQEQFVGKNDLSPPSTNRDSSLRLE